MKKIIVRTFMAFMVMIMFSFPCFAENVLYGCYQKNGGQLRVVNNPGECRPSEISLSWDKIGRPGLIWQGPWSDILPYELDDAVSYNGSSYISLAGSNLGKPPDSSPDYWEMLAQKGVMGEKGSKGDDGGQGAQGPQGEQGPAGPEGPQGTIGPAGPQGPQGSQGPIGATGAQGPIGATGAQGPKGDTGATGAQGPKGDTGETGEKGETGTTVRSYAPGVISAVDLTTCSNPSEALSCEGVKRVSVTLPDYASYVFDVTGTVTVTNQDGVEEEAEEVTRIEMFRPPEPGSPCGSNAIDIKVTLLGTSYAFRFCLTSDAPIYNVRNDPNVPDETKSKMYLTASYIPDWLIVFTLNGQTVKEITPLSEAYIDSASASWVNGSLRLVGAIRNEGDFASNFIVTATNIMPASVCIKPVEPYTLFLHKDETRPFAMDLLPCGVIPTTTAKLTLTLKSPAGHVYDQVDVIWDNP